VTGYLHGLVERALGPAVGVEPQYRSRFEPRHRPQHAWDENAGPPLAADQSGVTPDPGGPTEDSTSTDEPVPDTAPGRPAHDPRPADHVPTIDRSAPTPPVAQRPELPGHGTTPVSGPGVPPPTSHEDHPGGRHDQRETRLAEQAVSLAGQTPAATAAPMPEARAAASSLRRSHRTGQVPRTAATDDPTGPAATPGMLAATPAVTAEDQASVPAASPHHASRFAATGEAPRSAQTTVTPWPRTVTVHHSDPAAETAPTVTVTIGRVEVVAPTPTPAAPPALRPQRDRPTLPSLADYLQQRAGH
jgi:hypothetical protein